MCPSARSLLARAVLVAAAAAALAGCGSGASREAAPARGDFEQGERVFADAGCGDCHTLSAAGAKGTSGPNLDELRPSFARVVRQVERGGRGMPSFAGRLDEGEIEAVSRFVAQKASRAVSVAASFKPDDTEISDCDGDFACYEQAFANLAYERGPKHALATFDQAMVDDEDVEANCHRISHAIGAGALARFRGEVGEAFARGSASCWSGYYHGILERAFRDVPESRIAAVSRRLCSSNKIRRTTFLAYQCVHGLGHGLMIYMGYELPAALEVCDRLATGWDRTSCTGGVFMENQQSSYGFRSKWLKSDDLIYPCNVVAERHKLYCYLMATSHILPEVDWNWRRAAEWCRKSDPKWVATCFQSLGRDASGQTRQDAEEIVAVCDKADEMARECVFGAARDIVANDFGPRRAVLLCRAARAEMRAYCFYGIGTILGSFGSTNVEATCRRIAGRYGADCVRGAVGRPFER